MSVTSKVQQATKTLNEISRTGGANRRWRWYHGAIFYGVAQVVTFGLAGLTTAVTGQKVKSFRDTFGDVNYFRALRQAKVAPPSWVFGPAWTINSISTIWGALQVLNKLDDTPGKHTFLALQGASWLNYVIFNAAYFTALAHQRLRIDHEHVHSDHFERPRRSLPLEGYESGFVAGDADPLAAHRRNSRDLPGAMEPQRPLFRRPIHRADTLAGKAK